ncbi:VOC family protein [Tsukamurella paurometabola]|uniref:Predicted enzyme related to lactoylglutathione lyase n=1 Tax=Tsukamurella paurometabola TaxID=2061 RepID=A0A3P8LDD4_TSUPA|nr:VOC family protein [Tsukamurella paurometabola]MBS4103208.1 VOC family protein [Tsukamurella paurometabola]UEA85355.1 VOC family protein [Tsukamurella paurometabola]VDR37972.1 Predicted enzyme related to lactoylglutathione lyase [Tsukamurella paurometabola]
MTTLPGPDFLALQVRDVERSAQFYETAVGLRRAPQSPPGAVVFAGPIPFAVREPLPGVDLDAAAPGPGVGMALWMGCEDAPALHDRLAEAGVHIVRPPAPGPFGTAFTFLDPDGYAVTMHDAA